MFDELAPLYVGTDPRTGRRRGLETAIAAVRKQVPLRCEPLAPSVKPWRRLSACRHRGFTVGARESGECSRTYPGSDRDALPRPLFNPVNAATSESLSSKSKSAMFSENAPRGNRFRKHDVTALDATAAPPARASYRFRSRSRSPPGRPSTAPWAIGDQASVTIPCCSPYCRTPSLVK